MRPKPDTNHNKKIAVWMTEKQYKELEHFTNRLWFKSMSHAVRALIIKAMDNPDIIREIEEENR